MKMEEYKSWLNEKSKLGWEIDEVTWVNKREALAFNGEESGRYVRIDRTGMMEIGYYEGAFPYISDGLFKRVAFKDYGSFGEAIDKAVHSGGMIFLMPLLVDYAVTS